MKYLLFILILLNVCCKETGTEQYQEYYAFNNDKYDGLSDSIKEIDINESDTKLEHVQELITGNKSQKGKKRMEYLRKKRTENKRTFSYQPSQSFDHITHIRKKSIIGQTDGETHKPKYFVDYVINNLLEKPEYKKYITDRRLLRKLDNIVCWDNYVLIQDSLSNGDELRIEIKDQQFIPDDHHLKNEGKSNYLVEVVKKYPFGAVYSKHPNRELKFLKIEINGIYLETSVEQYRNLYEPNFCNFGSHSRITEAYEDGDNLYVYIFGGNAADSYFAKLVFDKYNGYVTSIIADYIPLSKYGSFGSHFIGY